LNCNHNALAIIAGLLGGAIAGITIACAAIVIAGAAAGGGAYAISQNYGTQHEHTVHHSPLYKAQTRATEVCL